jgi:crotonobetainyl-CoA:carnitine CoA-transferase CaiB-like acyl-CoA transferase
VSAPALHGLRVLDFTRHLPGPFCTLLLADLGADVVKVEAPPLGDPTRLVPPAVGDDSAVHAALNRGKRSVVLDIRADAGRDAARALAARADVVVDGFRPGVLDRLGLGADALMAENPRLVYCALSGWGTEGPLAERAGHDITYAARGGMLDLNRDAAGAVTVPGAQVADGSGALLALSAILAALVERERTGRGRRVEVSLLGGVLALLTMPLARTLAGGERRSELSGDFAGYTVYRCRDGRELAVGALEPKFWEALCRGLGAEELIPRQWDGGPRGREVRARLTALFSGRDRDEWLRVLEPLDACVEPVLTPEEAAADAQAAALLIDQPDGAGGVFRAVAPFAASGLSTAPPRPAPRLGQHTDEVLAELAS